VKKIILTTIALFSFIQTSTALSNSDNYYVCSELVNMRNHSLEHIKVVLPYGTELIKTSRTKSKNGTIYSRYIVVGHFLRGWIADSLVCPQNNNEPATEQPATEKPSAPKPEIEPTPENEPSQSFEARKIVVNLSKNILYYYENGNLIRYWNIGTARAGKSTPTGKFSIWYKDVCPPYFGSKGDKNVPGCTPENPFGPKALWFSGFIYGIHGTNEPYLIDEGTSSNQRRVSSGCVRNSNQNIEWLYSKVKVGDPVVVTW
jgi:lipoprotein-anchoring transpeptidase ErfK/SrfK